MSQTSSISHKIYFIKPDRNTAGKEKASRSLSIKTSFSKILKMPSNSVLNLRRVSLNTLHNRSDKIFRKWLRPISFDISFKAHTSD